PPGPTQMRSSLRSSKTGSLAALNASRYIWRALSTTKRRPAETLLPAAGCRCSTVGEEFVEVLQVGFAVSGGHVRVVRERRDFAGRRQTLRGRSVGPDRAPEEASRDLVVVKGGRPVHERARCLGVRAAGDDAHGIE